MQEAIRAEKEKHDKLVQEMRGKYKDSQESLASRFNDTLELKQNLEKRVKDLEREVDKLQPVSSLVGVCAGVCFWFCGHHALLDMHLVKVSLPFHTAIIAVTATLVLDTMPRSPFLLYISFLTCRNNVLCRTSGKLSRKSMTKQQKRLGRSIRRGYEK
jgi:hypothetical protein